MYPSWLYRPAAPNQPHSHVQLWNKYCSQPVCWYADVQGMIKWPVALPSIIMILQVPTLLCIWAWWKVNFCHRLECGVQQLQKLLSHCNRCVWELHVLILASRQYAELQSAKMVHIACAPLQRSEFYVFNSVKSVCLDGTHKCKIAHFGADGRVKREHWCLASGNARQCVVHLITA